MPWNYRPAYCESPVLEEETAVQVWTNDPSEVIVGTGWHGIIRLAPAAPRRTVLESRAEGEEARMGATVASRAGERRSRPKPLERWAGPAAGSVRCDATHSREPADPATWFCRRNRPGAEGDWSNLRERRR
jgi:hypothetical protein